MNITHCLGTAILVATCGAAPLASAQQHHRIVTPGELKWMDVGSLPPGAKVAVLEGDPGKEGPVTIRIKLPPNFRIAPHFHSTVERSTILSGTLNIGMGEKFDKSKTTAMAPGTLLLMPPKMPHFAWTTGEVVFQLNVMGPWTVTYINPTDDPRRK
jgi:hypothetical protein